MNTLIEGLENRWMLASPHFVVDPVFADQGTTLNAKGSVAGLGNEDVTVLLSATGRATVVCTNPAGRSLLARLAM